MSSEQTHNSPDQKNDDLPLKDRVSGWRARLDQLSLDLETDISKLEALDKSAMLDEYLEPDFVPELISTEELLSRYQAADQLKLSEAADIREYYRAQAQLMALTRRWEDEQRQRYQELYEEMEAAPNDEEYQKRQTIVTDFNDQYSVMYEPFRLLQNRWAIELEEMMQATALRIGEQINQSFVEVGAEILQNEDLLAEIRTGFVNRVVKPKLDWMVKNEGFGQAEADQVFQSVRNTAVSRVATRPTIMNPGSLIAEIKGDEFFVSETHRREGHVLKALLEDQQLKLLEKLVTATHNRLASDQLTRQLTRDIDLKRQKTTFSNQVLADVMGVGQYATAVRNVQLWEVMKNDPQLGILFGEELEALDQELRTTFITKLLENQKVPDIAKALAYFLNSELLIDCLWILGSPDKQGRYKLRETLTRIRLVYPDQWQTLVTEVLQRFPDLQTVIDEISETDEDGDPISSDELTVDSNEALQNTVDTRIQAGNLNPQEVALGYSLFDTTTLLKRALVINQLPLEDFQAIFELMKRIDILVEDRTFGGNTFELFVRNLCLNELQNSQRGPKRGGNRFQSFNQQLPVVLKLSRVFASLLDEGYGHKVSVLTEGSILSFLIGDANDSRSVQAAIFNQAVQTWPHTTFANLMRAGIHNPRVFFSEAGVKTMSEISDALLQLPLSLQTQIVNDISGERLSAQQVLLLIHEAGLIFTDEWKLVAQAIFDYPDRMLKSPIQVGFYKRVIAEHGNRAMGLIKQYREMITLTDEPTEEDHDLAIEWLRQFRVLTPDIFNGFIEAKKTHTVEIYTARLHDLAHKMMSGSKITEDERALPYFSELLIHVFPNHSEGWTSYETNDRCDDRSQDLAGYQVRQSYPIDTLSQADMIMTAPLEETKVEGIKNQIIQISVLAKEDNFEPEKMRQRLTSNLDAIIAEQVALGNLSHLEIDKLQTNEAKLFILVMENLYSQSAVDPQKLQELMLWYIFTEFVPIQEYLEGTTDRVTNAKNQEYALLSELHTFFSDRMKDTGRALGKTAVTNDQIVASLPYYFDQAVNGLQTVARRERMNQLQLGKLGLSDSFVAQIAKVLNKGRANPLSPEQVAKIINRYQRLVDLQAASTSTRKATKTFHGELRGQVNKTAQAMAEVTGQAVDPRNLRLADFQIDQLLAQNREFAEGAFIQEEFLAYTIERTVNIFADSVNVIDQELAKFQSKTGGETRPLYGYITKSKESANARMVGGVCVSGDNPNEGQENQWDMPNYLQLVLEDQETNSCQGLLLMHTATFGDEKVLAVSFNPSSTFVLRTDEAALFKSLFKAVTDFAKDNKFDKVVVSKSSAIRTNRTGGLFEQALDEQIRNTNQQFSFETPQRFSYSPEYLFQEVDVLWSAPNQNLPPIQGGVEV